MGVLALCGTGVPVSLLLATITKRRRNELDLADRVVKLL
jgi:hypothetical protein